MNGTPVHLQLFVNTLNPNPFPVTFLLPDERIFLTVNHDTTIYNWKNNMEEQLSWIPNGVCIMYPMTGMGMLLLIPESDYTPEVLICGGLMLEDTKEPHEFSTKDSVSDQYMQLLRTPKGIKRGWQVEHML